MITLEEIAALTREEIPERAQFLTSEDIPILINLLQEQSDNLRFHSFELLQYRSRTNSDVYPFWDEFPPKLKSSNAFVRSIGVMLIAENARWDNEGKFDAILEEILVRVDDEKPMTERQTIQSLCRVVPFKQHLIPRIVEKLLSVDLSSRKDTQLKIQLMDILSVFAVTRRYHKDERVEAYIVHAMTGSLLDKKAKKIVESWLNA
jgi:hypothetical protein